MAKTQTWKTLLAQHDKLKKQATGSLFERVKLLKRVLEKTTFVADMKAEGKLPTKELDTRISDTCTNITVLIQMLVMFPRKAQWTNGDLATMSVQVMDKMRAGQKRNRTRKPSATRKTASLSEVRELKAEKNRYKLEAVSSQKVVDSLENSLDAALTTIATLKAENKRLKAELRKFKTAGKPKRRRVAT